MINWQILASKKSKTLVLRIHRAYGVRGSVLRVGKHVEPGSPSELMSTLASFAHLAAPCPPFPPSVGWGAALGAELRQAQRTDLCAEACWPLRLYWPPSSFPSVLSWLSFDTILNGMKYHGSIIHFHSSVFKTSFSCSHSSDTATSLKSSVTIKLVLWGRVGLLLLCHI